MNGNLKKDLSSRLPYGVKVQYKGIVNGKELSAYKKTEPKDEFNNGKPTDEWLRWMNMHPQQVEGDKVGLIKNVKICKDYMSFYVGKFHGYTKLCWEPKPILFPLSCISEEITVNGKTFIPIVEMAKIHGFKCDEYRIENENGTIVLYTSYAKHPEVDYSTESFFEVDIDDFDIDCGAHTFVDGTESDTFYPVKNQVKIFDFLHENHINYRLEDDQFICATNEYQ